MKVAHERVTASRIPHEVSAEPAEAHEDLADFARALITSRQNVSPKRLVEPGPDDAQLERLLEAAAAAPDHDMLLPWRLVIVSAEKRRSLGDVFALALIDRDSSATLAEVEAARQKAHRAPLLMLAIARLADDGDPVPGVERVVSLGCAIQNILLTAHALGFGAGLASGQALRSPRLRELFALLPGEAPVCFITIGTVGKRKALRARPASRAFTTTL